MAVIVHGEIMYTQCNSHT